MKHIIIIIAFLPIFSGAFQLDWSGYYLSRIQHTRDLEEEKYNNSVEQHLRMDSVARVSDGLQLNLRFFLGSSEKASLGMAHIKNFISYSDIQDITLNPVHFYSQYNTEFMQLSIGRMPFHFGLGLTYSVGDHFAEPVYNNRDGVSIRLEYDNFYIKPYGLVYSKENINGQDIGTGNDFAVALEAGYSSKDMSLGILHKTAIMNSNNDLTSFSNSPYRPDSTTNIFVEYTHSDLSVSAEWGSQKEWSQYAVVLQADWKTPFDSVVLGVAGAYVTEEYETQPNWNPSFILWDYFYLVVGNTVENHTWGLNDAVVFSPSVKIEIKENVDLSLAYVWMTDRSNMTIKNNELRAAMTYDSQKGFVWANEAGFILMENSNQESNNRLSVRSSAVIFF